jgi:WD40 repeat protein
MRHLRVEIRGSPEGLHFSADGKSLILVGRLSGFHVLDAASGVERRALGVPNSMTPRRDLCALAISRDGATGVTLHPEGTLVVSDLTAGKRRGEFKTSVEITRYSYHPIDLTVDGKQLVAPYKDGSLHLLDTASGKEVLAFEMPSSRPQKIQNNYPMVTISPDGRYLAYGGTCLSGNDSAVERVTLCDMKTGKRVRELPPDRIGELTFTPDSRALAITDAESIRFFDVSSGKQTKTIRKPSSYALFFSPKGGKVATFAGSCLYLWDVASGRPLHPPIGHTWFPLTIHFFRDGKRLIANTFMWGEMIVWDIAARRPLATHHAGKLQKWLSVATDGASIRFLDWDREPPLSPRGKLEFPLKKKSVAKEEQGRLVGVDLQGIQRWNLTTGRVERESEVAIPKAPGRFAMSDDGRRLALATEGIIHLRDVKGGKRTAALPGKGWASHLAFSSDGRQLLIWWAGLRVLDGTTGKLVRDLTSDKTRYRISSISSIADDGRKIALQEERVTAIHEGQLCIREIASGTDRLQIPFSRRLNDLVFSPDGRFLAGRSDDGSIVVFSTATGKQLARWQREQNSVSALAFSPDSRLLATGSLDGTILLWKIPESDGLPAKLSAEEAIAFWRALADGDAARANRALAGLVAAPAQAVPFIKERLQSTEASLSPERLARLVADLDADAFKVRERATRELAEAGSYAADLLRKGLANKPSLEAKRRMERLLDRLDKGDFSERLRSLRTIEVLERIGTPQAKDVLHELNRRSLPAELREEIEASLRRMEMRRSAASRKSPTP